MKKLIMIIFIVLALTSYGFCEEELPACGDYDFHLEGTGNIQYLVIDTIAPLTKEKFDKIINNDNAKKLSEVGAVLHAKFSSTKFPDIQSIVIVYRQMVIRIYPLGESWTNSLPAINKELKKVLCK